mgnify:CR=1 FL=1
MKEVKPSKKPLAIYYAIVLLVLLVINLVVMPHSRPIRVRLWTNTTSTLPAATASVTFWSAGRSNVSPLPYSSAAPMMVYPACFA